MRIKLGKKSLTFMIIPDANRKVIRFRVSVLLLYLFPVASLSILCVTLLVHLNNLQNKIEKNELANELAHKTQQYEQSINTKNETIAQLQNEIVDISSQTEDMKLKVEELKKLEQEIRGVTSGEPGDKGPVSAALTSRKGLGARGVGGQSLEVGPAETNALITDTKQELSSLDVEVTVLFASISKAKEDLIEHLRLMRITPSIWPTVSYDISSRFGYRKDPFTRRPSYHAGVDIAGNSGDPVYATADGIVISAGYDRAYGNNVIVKHASGVSTRYAHLKKFSVKERQKISQGGQIGQLGSTGRSTGPHLHYEVIKHGETIDPMPYLEAARKDG